MKNGKRIHHLSTFNWYAVGMAVGTILTIIFFSKITPVIPGSLIAILIATLTVQLFHLPVETIGSRFGSIPSSLPYPSVPDLDFEIIKNLIRPAFTIAILGGIESLLSAVVADGMIGGNHKKQYGVSCARRGKYCFGYFWRNTGDRRLARTATNVKNGGRTPVAGIVHALTLLIIMLLVGKWATLIPMSCLAGILIIVAYNMSEYETFIDIIKGSRSDAAVLITTFLLTVLFDLTLAIEIGLVLAVFLFMRKMMKISNVSSFLAENKNANGKDENSINK